MYIIKWWYTNVINVRKKLRIILKTKKLIITCRRNGNF